MRLIESVRGLLTTGVPGDEVEEAARFLCDRAKALRRRENAKALVQFEPGDLVVVKGEHGSRKLPAGIVGKVERLGQKNVLVDFGVHRKWRVPALWLEAAPEGVEFNSKIVTRESLLKGLRHRQYQETPPELA
jgi:hypothetical protein